MKLGYELTIEQTQKLSMTPELIQAIQILQFNHQELIDYVENEILENPILEEEKSYDDSKEIDIREKIREADYEEHRMTQWEYSTDDDEEYTYEQYVSDEDTLEEYLLMQLEFSKLKEQKHKIGIEIIEAIDDNGYLSVSIEEIARNLNVDEDLVEDVLNVIQTFEPTGVGARNLKECLIIQLASRGILTEEIEYIIENMLEDLANHKIAYIAKTLNMTTKEIQQIVDLIKTLEPKPGRLFGSGDATRYISPDIIVEKIDGEYVVTNNDNSVPKLMVSSYYNKLSSQAETDQELNKYLNDRFNSAVWLIKSIEQRKQTIYNVASAVVKYQQDFFDKGEKYLKTLTLKQIAEEVGIHESTVSRSINGKYMESPRGMFELKYFFSSGVSSDDGTGVSSNSVKSIIKEIISSEDTKKPYSDQDMVEILKSKGIDISRRTVAKYREVMGILSSSKRRRF